MFSQLGCESESQPTNSVDGWCKSECPHFENKTYLQNAMIEYVNDSNCNTAGGEYATGNTYGWPMNSWCVDLVTDMHYLINGTIEDLSGFNEDISSWDVSGVTDRTGMFYKAAAFNQPLDSWDV